MPKKIIKPKTKTIVKRKLKTTPDLAQTYDVQAIGRRHIALRTGAEGLEIETLVATDGGDRHLATLVFAAAEAAKLRDALAALVK